MKSFEELYEELNEKKADYMFIRAVRYLEENEARDYAKTVSVLHQMELMMSDGNYDTLSLIR